MPATPAWPLGSLPRVFVDVVLSPGASAPLDGGQANYLRNVLRLEAGAPVHVFDDRTGEWLARVASLGKRGGTLEVVAPTRPREAVPDLWLAFSPLKAGRTELIVEKATELGAARIVPIVTERSVVRQVKPERLRAHAIEAAEQCERTALPAIDPLLSLPDLLAAWPATRPLLFADERGDGGGLGTPAPAGILVGPEGGWSDGERAAILAHPAARLISLGPRILRAETAAIAALAAWMALSGDWPRAGGAANGEQMTRDLA